jgi:hypothetical protein
MDQWDGIDPIRTRLRVLVAHVDSTIASLETAEGGSKQALEQAWANLVGGLALGEEPEVRTCPSCGRSIMRAAVRCRYCMKFSPSQVAE